jgi:hypothetical protein
MFKTVGAVGPRGLILTRSGYLLITGGPDVWQKFFNKKVWIRLICTGRDNANIISGSVTVRNWSGNGKLIYRVTIHKHEINFSFRLIAILFSNWKRISTWKSIFCQIVNCLPEILIFTVYISFVGFQDKNFRSGKK